MKKDDNNNNNDKKQTEKPKMTLKVRSGVKAGTDVPNSPTGVDGQ